ncbi:MAG: signal peptidase II [Alphaproteobacteria bacterium]|nr:signal peptidase II [Alphaproteobacteria bacterium]
MLYRWSSLVVRTKKHLSHRNRPIADLFSQCCISSTLFHIVVSVLVGTIILDQVTKFAARTFLSAPPYKVEVTPFFDLSLGFNTGVSFGVFAGVFSDQQWPLIALTITIAIALIVWALRVDRPIEAGAIALIAGGAIGNIIDRIRQGAVTDFLDFHLMGWRWPAFNFADVFIFVGAALLVIAPIIPTATGKNEKYLTDNEP